MSLLAAISGSPYVSPSSLTDAGRRTNDSAIIPSSSPVDPTTILLPTYSNEVLLAAANPPALIHLPTFNSLRNAITAARQLVFALHASSGTAGKGENQVTLTGDARAFDYTLAHYLYETRFVSGDFGERGRGGAGLDAGQEEKVLKLEGVVKAEAEARARLEGIERAWRREVVDVLAARLVEREGGNGGSGGGLFGRRRSSLGFGKGKVDWNALGRVAAPLVMEAKEVHLRLGVVIEDGLRRVGGS